MFKHNPEVKLVTEAMLAYQAKQAGLDIWDEGDHEAAAMTFLRHLAGPEDPRGIYERWFPHLINVARANRRDRFASICDSIAVQALYGA